MNDLDGLPLLQGHLVLQEGSVGFDGDVGLTWRGEGQSVSLPSTGPSSLGLGLPPAFPPPHAGPLDFCPLPTLPRGAHPFPPTTTYSRDLARQEV